MFPTDAMAINRASCFEQDNPAYAESRNPNTNQHSQGSTISKAPAIWPKLTLLADQYPRAGWVMPKTQSFVAMSISEKLSQSGNARMC